MPEALVGVYEPRGCANSSCPMFGGCGLEDLLLLSIHLNVLGNAKVRLALVKGGYPLHLVVSEVRPVAQAA